MRLVIVEGTPEEIAAAVPHLFVRLNGSAALQSSATPAVSTEAGAPLEEPQVEPSASPDRPARERVHLYVSVRVARSCLARRELSREQLAVLRAIYEAHPEFVLTSQLADQIGYSRSQFAGLMGAFGRRVSHTTGYAEEAGASFFDQEWDHTAYCNRYRMPETVREAMRLEGLV